jgi:hypothetical protein
MRKLFQPEGKEFVNAMAPAEASQVKKENVT